MTVGNIRLTALALLAASCALPISAWAGGSLYVDDSGIAPRGGCQLESWMRAFTGGGSELTTVPACSTGPVEWSLALSSFTGPVSHQATPGIKWQLIDNAKGGFGLALATTATLEAGRLESTDVYAAPSWVLGQAQEWAINVNVGANRQRAGTWRGTAGLGLQYTPRTLVTILAEVLWRDRRGNVVQGGLRFNLDEKISMDALIGRSRDDVVDRWATLGLNVAF